MLSKSQFNFVYWLWLPIVPEMTYNVFSGTLNPTHFTSLPIVMGRPLHFAAVVFILLSFCILLLFFLAYSQQSEIGCLPYFHKWCGLSALCANLECMSEICFMWLAENTGCKDYTKKWPSAHHRTSLSVYIFASKARIDNLKKITC